MSNEIHALVVNGKRYVPEESGKYIEATVQGRITFEFSDGPAHPHAAALVLKDVAVSDEYRFHDRLPAGTRIRIYVIESQVATNLVKDCLSCKFEAEYGAKEPCASCAPGYKNWTPR